MKEELRKALATAHDDGLVDELLEAHAEATRNFYEGGNRLSAVEGGRFCEAAFRMLEEHAFGTFTPIGRTLETEPLARRLLGLPRGVAP
nr:hypothetical protein [Micromonospora sp. DSM 115978]